MSDVPPPSVPPPPGGGSYVPPPPPPPGAAPAPGSDRTLMVVLSYLGLLALIPYFTKKDDPEIMWHARNGVGLLIVDFVVWVGYFIIRQKVKGIVAIVAWIILLFVTCGAGSGLISILGAIDGYMQAQQLQQGHPIGEWTFFNDHR